MCTCAFDAIFVGIAITHTDYPSYTSYIDDADNDLLKNVKW